MKIGYESKKNYRICKVGDNPNCIFDENNWCIKGTI